MSAKTSNVAQRIISGKKCNFDEDNVFKLSQSASQSADMEEQRGRIFCEIVSGTSGCLDPFSSYLYHHTLSHTYLCTLLLIQKAVSFRRTSCFPRSFHLHMTKSFSWWPAGPSNTEQVFLLFWTQIVLGHHVYICLQMKFKFFLGFPRKSYNRFHVTARMCHKVLYRFYEKE